MGVIVALLLAQTWVVVVVVAAVLKTWVLLDKPAVEAEILVAVEATLEDIVVAGKNH